MVLCLSTSSSKAGYNWQHIKIATRYWHDRKRDKSMAKNGMEHWGERHDTTGVANNGMEHGVKYMTQLGLPTTGWSIMG